MRNFNNQYQWHDVLKDEFNKEYFRNLKDFLKDEYKNKVIYPPKEDIFNAFKLTSFEDTNILILGQDPYYKEGQANGLAFSVKKGVAIPPSLSNIFKEIYNDLNLNINEVSPIEVSPCEVSPCEVSPCEVSSKEVSPIEVSNKKSLKTAKEGSLIPWAKQGVFLLNACLTVEKNRPNSHKGKGWEIFTDKVIKALNEREKPVIFILWGNDAQKKEKLITNNQHYILKASHPSPLSAYRGFFGCKHFSKANEILIKNKQPPINWII